MGQKVSPHGLRVGVIKDWNSKWYTEKENFADFLVEDHKIREYVKSKLYAAGISKILIERPSDDNIRITVLTARPGMVIGRGGSGVDQLKDELEKKTGKSVQLSIEEIRRSEMDAQLTAESVAESLERRVSYRRAMKQALQRTMKAGAKGAKILCSGRLGGAEIARDEKYSEGNVPLHTLRADIDYGFAEADTTYGKIGVKVWINHGEILDKGLQSPIREEKQDKRNKRGKYDKKNRKDRKGRRNSKFTERKNVIPKAANRRVRPKKEEPIPENQEGQNEAASVDQAPQAE
jgi:small subunit ribosomal protein S3